MSLAPHILIIASVRDLPLGSGTKDEGGLHVAHNQPNRAFGLAAEFKYDYFNSSDHIRI